MDAANHSSAVGSVSPPASSHGDRSAAKRRKLRKGTHSCWDCKRRKIRCIFASPKDKACVNCHRRGAPCIGQDLPEVSSSAVNSHRNIDSKIVRVESLLNDLANKLNGEPSNTEKQNEATTQPSPTNKPSPNNHHHSKSDEPDLTTVNSITRTLRHNHASISEQLIAALPCHQDTEILLRESQCSALYAHMLNNEQQGLFTKEMYCNKTTSTPPMPTSKTHPVLLARQMLFWCIVLQYPKIDRKHSFREPPRTIMKRIVTAVADLVTTNDDLHGSLESLECIMLEGTYHTYLGNLRRAWLVYRRAMLLAELMGVHRYPAQVLKSLDSEITFHPLSMWYRIVYMDRYLCLLLGLPQGTTDKSMSSIANIQKDPCDIRRFERALSSIAARILERNHHSPSTLSFAHDRAIDTELLDVSRSMPEEFWHIPRFEGVAPGSFEDARTVEPFIAQVYYFQLLNQLHWPYMLRTIHKIRKQDESVNRHEDYSTIACANASREILSRFVAYRSFNHFALCFRPVDLAALTAALTLILTHLDVHLSRGEDPPTVSRCILAHQRMSDRTLLNQVVRKLCMVSEFNEDSMNLEGARLLESLLRVEAEAARGEDYQWTSTSRGDGVQSQDENGDEDEDGDIAIRIPIPCLGSICISRKGCISKQAPGHAPKNPHPHANDADIYPGIPQAPTSLENITAYDMLTPMTHDGSMDSSRTLDGLTPETAISMGVDASLSGVLLGDGPAISAGMDEWTFQGVDMAFFDSLIMSVPGTGGVEGGGEGI